MHKTIVEKIFSTHSNKDVKAGDVVVANIDFCFGQDGTSMLVIDAFRNLGAKKVFDKDKFRMVIDHSAPSPSIGVSEVHKKMRNFAKEHDLKVFDIGCGVCHEVIPEAGLILPGSLVVGADSHTCTYGALGAFSTGMGSTDVAVALATGKNWFKVPETIKIILTGKPAKGVYSKDAILYVIGKLGAGYATYKAIEFSGEYIKGLSMDSRFTITNMAIEMGAKAGLMEPDEKTYGWLKAHKVKGEGLRVKSDKDAKYSEVLKFDVSKITPQIAKPHTVDNVTPINKLRKTKIDQAFLGTCTNGRLEDLMIACSILKNRKINKNVKMIIAPASKDIFQKAMEKGVISEFVKSGACVVSPGCGPCVGTHNGVLSSGEACISTANRNFKGRMGNPDAFIYLGSPATVAASALEGKITDPRKYIK
ncbi:MAG: 3-isopropylmalate dehydratase large subunit [Candidatus Omnitrophica bacterium CG22_combo_CG10-13_8_21_14_all_43_16]|nr:MAG: 3-isopropylmalate dehydratase large subunit [Candidatus Omnitrophica bacterium CG22_combo_CG10-13_8_21_14_all_43_16]